MEETEKSSRQRADGPEPTKSAQQQAVNEQSERIVLPVGLGCPRRNRVPGRATTLIREQVRKRSSKRAAWPNEVIDSRDHAHRKVLASPRKPRRPKNLPPAGRITRGASECWRRPPKPNHPPRAVGRSQLACCQAPPENNAVSVRGRTPGDRHSPPGEGCVTDVSKSLPRKEGRPNLDSRSPSQGTGRLLNTLTSLQKRKAPNPSSVRTILLGFPEDGLGRGSAFKTRVLPA
jgi:hypothetical protein